MGLSSPPVPTKGGLEVFLVPSSSGGSPIAPGLTPLPSPGETGLGKYGVPGSPAAPTSTSPSTVILGASL